MWTLSLHRANPDPSDTCSATDFFPVIPHMLSCHGMESRGTFPNTHRRRHTRWFLGVFLLSGCATQPVEVRRSWTPRAQPMPAAHASMSERELLELELARVSTELLQPALAPTNPTHLRAQAMLALARFERSSALQGLLGGIVDKAPSVRQNAAFGLGQIGLALSDTEAEHRTAVEAIEVRLMERLATEKHPRVRVALVRALGRMAQGAGLRRLIAMATEPTPIQADVLYALGVAGATGEKSLRADAEVHTIARATLFSQDAKLRRAAAYLILGQELPLGSEVWARLATETDAQTKIYLWRSLYGDHVPESIWRNGLVDTDWRVQVEAILTTASMPSADMAPIVRALGQLLQEQLASKQTIGRRDGKDQVVTTICEVMQQAASEHVPDDIRKHLEDANAALGGMGPTYAAPHCSCARALDVVDGKPDMVRRCVEPRWPEARTRRLEVEVLSRVGASTQERTTWLAAALEDPATEVRGTAAWELAQIKTPLAAKVVSAKLLEEKDPYVASALLSTFRDGRVQPSSDETFRVVVERFRNRLSEAGVASLLLESADALRGRTSENARIAVAHLRDVADPQIRSAAMQVPRVQWPPRERPPENLPPPMSQLPLGAIVRTNVGDIRIAFEREKTPLAVSNFTALARAGYYDGLRFHRVRAGFVAQTGDPRGDGAGDPGYAIPCEHHDGRFQRGAVGMATAKRDTGGSQFFFTHSEQPQLDGQHTLFAHVVDGFDVMDALVQDDWIETIQFLGAVPSR